MPAYLPCLAFRDCTSLVTLLFVTPCTGFKAFSHGSALPSLMSILEETTKENVQRSSLKFTTELIILKEPSTLYIYTQVINRQTMPTGIRYQNVCLRRRAAFFSAVFICFQHMSVCFQNCSRRQRYDISDHFAHKFGAFKAGVRLSASLSRQNRWPCQQIALLVTLCHTLMALLPKTFPLL